MLRRIMIGFVCFAILVFGLLPVMSQTDDTPTPSPFLYGTNVNTGKEQEGYVLVAMLKSHMTFLISNDGRIVHTWKSDYEPALSGYLTADGTLIRTVALPEAPFGRNTNFVGGRVEAFNWDGDFIWSFDDYGDTFVGHHDIKPMPNGHILVVAYDRRTAEEALIAGRKPDLLPKEGELWSEKVIEVDPKTGDIVWEWSVWDHLIQDFDPASENYGILADHPERINLNYVGRDLAPDWLHINAIDYNAALDQILLSVPYTGEVWIIDHSLTTEQARGEAGGLLYRWGNPRVYGVGTVEDQQLDGQHHAQWIPEGYPGGGHILVFDNGSAARGFSRVVEFIPPLNADGTYGLTAGQAALPKEPVWQYVAEPPQSLYAPVRSGVQRQPNGNTLITDGSNGRIFEVSPDGEIVWEYYLPIGAWAFRAERYNLPLFATLDSTVDYSKDLGFDNAWIGLCKDNTTVRLRAYLSDEIDVMTSFREKYGETAEKEWSISACADHGGLS